MPELRFEWDAGKARANVQKHGVSFEEAEAVFVDEHALLMDDPDHSATEDWFVLMGLSSRFRVLVVVHTYRERVRYYPAHLGTQGDNSRAGRL